MPIGASGHGAHELELSPFIDGSALWHIVVISLAFGAGLALAFGVALLGIKRGEEGRSAGARAGGFLLSGVCAVLWVVAVAVGIYVMAHPAKTKPLKVVTATPTASITSIGQRRDGVGPGSSLHGRSAA